MVFLIVFILELGILFILARALTMHLSLLLYKVGLREQAVMHILAFLFLPGTFLHELSHYLMCVILRVKVFGMSLLPKPMEGNAIKMGTLQHAQTNFLFDLIIGAGPFIFGNLILFSLLFFLSSNFQIGLNWLTVLTGFVIFEIGNTMFSSKKDMEGSFKLLLIILFIFGIAYLFGFRISVEQLDQSLPSSFISIIKQADIFLLVPITLDLLIIGLVYGFTNLNNLRQF